jgi:hypothetical protein
MSPNLLALLGQQSTSQAGSGFREDPDAPVPDVGDFTEELERLRAAERARLEQEDNPVAIVNGRQGGSMQQAPQLDEGPMNMGNRDWIEERNQAAKNVPQHKGMFGIKGTLRDILGTVGDAFVVGAGGDAIYGAQRQKERESDAMAGFTADPQAGAERMGGVNPDRAILMNNARQTDEYRRDNLESQEAARQSLIEDRRLGNLKDASIGIQRLFGSKEAQANPEMAITIAQQIAKRNGVPLEELLGIPLSELTPEAMGLISRSDITVNQTEALARRDQQLGISQQTADASTLRASRPPQGRAPPRPLSVQEQVDTKVMNGQPLTTGEQRIYDRKENSGRGGRAPPANVTPPARRFERVKTPN